MVALIHLMVVLHETQIMLHSILVRVVVVVVKILEVVQVPQVLQVLEAL
jgi:hypothetical protein